MKEIKANNQFVEQLYEKYKRRLLSIIRRYVSSKEDCEDIFQDVIERIIQYAPKLRGMPTPKLEAYISMVARGVSIDYLRKAHKNVVVDMDDEVLQNLLSNGCNVSGASHDLFNRVDLSVMMRGLTAEEQTLLIGKYYFGMEAAELTEITGVSETGVRSKLHRARKKLLAQWKESDLRMEDFINE